MADLCLLLKRTEIAAWRLANSDRRYIIYACHRDLFPVSISNSYSTNLFGKYRFLGSTSVLEELAKMGWFLLAHRVKLAVLFALNPNVFDIYSMLEQIQAQV